MLYLTGSEVLITCSSLTVAITTEKRADALECVAHYRNLLRKLKAAQAVQKLKKKPMRNIKKVESTMRDASGKYVTDGRGNRLKVPLEPPQLVEPHPLPVTLGFLCDGLRLMRKVSEEALKTRVDDRGGDAPQLRRGRQAGARRR